MLDDGQALAVCDGGGIDLSFATRSTAIELILASGAASEQVAQGPPGGRRAPPCAVPGGGVVPPVVPSLSPRCPLRGKKVRKTGMPPKDNGAR